MNNTTPVNGVPTQKVARFNLNGRFSHSASFGAITAAPPTLGRVVQYIKDQWTTNYCTAAARSAAGSYLFGQNMSFEFQTAKEGQFAGAPIFGGTDPNIADKASEEYGFLPDEQSPHHFATDGWQIPAEWQLYPATLDGQAVV